MSKVLNYIKWIRSKVGREKIMLNFAGACVTDEQGRLLLQKRAGSENAWGFPGGAMEIGESAAETAIREVQEETGLLIEINELLGIYTKYDEVYPNGDQAQPIVISFLASIIGGELNPKNAETIELRFFNLDEVPHLFNKQHNDVLDDFLAGNKGVYR